MMISGDDIVKGMTDLWHYIANIPETLLNAVIFPNVGLSIYPLLCALMIAACFYAFKRGPKKNTSVKLLMRILFPKRIWLSASAKLDYQFVALSVVLLSTIVATAVLNYTFVENGVYFLLEHYWGPAKDPGISATICVIIVTLALFIAYEVAYWIEHYMGHHIPFLWEFHKMHHSAEVLTPFVNWRMHPVDSILFMNMIAFFAAITHGLTNYFLAKHYGPIEFAGANILFVFYYFMLAHLQHSHVWICFNGIAGRLFLSPAHHQIHHSTNPAHFGKNLGASLAIMDWIFGTLYIPNKKRQKLEYGISDGQYFKSLTSALFYPFFASAIILYNTTLRRWLMYCIVYKTKAAVKAATIDYATTHRDGMK